ncbi:MAG: copper resistance protein CopC [Longimicrobiales bacterium]|nr:copper resistance protein CopC [Longimicrobiales bacterium]
MTLPRFVPASLAPASLAVGALVLVLAGFVGPSQAAPASPDAPLHFELRTSAPKADSTVAPTREVRLWFTQEPQEGATQIRVMKGEARVPMSEVQKDAEDATSYFVTLDRPLPSGAYHVMWRSMAGDGHVVSGEFDFTVASGE